MKPNILCFVNTHQRLFFQCLSYPPVSFLFTIFSLTQFWALLNSQCITEYDCRLLFYYLLVFIIIMTISYRYGHLNHSESCDECESG